MKSISPAIAKMNAEQLPIPPHKLHGWTHFAGLYAGEHVAATEFVIGATFVALGATTVDILVGLLIGNILAILSWTLITTPIAVQTRLSLYTYLHKIAGDSMSDLYNAANVLIFTVISAAMITVSCTAVRFDRSRLTTGIVHVGVGGFHRSHEAFYTDLLLQSEDVSQWGICGVGLRESDRKMATILKQQDYLYTLIVKHPDGKVETKVIGSIVDFLLGCDDPAAVIDRMADPETKIVSLTITEGGYNVDAETGEFDISNPDAQYDVENPSTPRLVFGYLTAALNKRRQAGLPAFTVQSCDNVQHNGDFTRKMLVGFARLQDAELADWIGQEVCFPNAMVDRIAPVTTESDIEFLRNECNVDDQWPAVCEPFRQWVIEDSFSAGRPDWQNCGAQFVEDVKPYEEMKLRLLNAGHSVLGILGSVFGYQTIDECVRDDLFSKYLRKFFDVEATPVLDAVEGIDLDAYKATLIERFGNPSIRDNLARICLESSSKLPVFLIPTIRQNLASGGSIRYAALVIAAWCYYSDKHADRHGQPLDVTDALKGELHEAAKATSNDRLSFLKVKHVFGDLAKDERLAKTYTEMIDRVYRTPDVKEHMQAVMRDPITP